MTLNIIVGILTVCVFLLSVAVVILGVCLFRLRKERIQFFDECLDISQKDHPKFLRDIEDLKDRLFIHECKNREDISHIHRRIDKIRCRL